MSWPLATRSGPQATAERTARCIQRALIVLPHLARAWESPTAHCRSPFSPLLLPAVRQDSRALCRPVQRALVGQAFQPGGSVDLSPHDRQAGKPDLHHQVPDNFVVVDQDAFATRSILTFRKYTVEPLR